MISIDELGKLQEAFFQKTGALYENIELLGVELYKLMLRDVIDVYKNESDLLRRKLKIDFDTSKYEIKSESRLRRPGHVFLFFGTNEPGKLIKREETVEYKEKYNVRVAAVEKREAALLSAQAEKAAQADKLEADGAAQTDESEAGAAVQMSESEADGAAQTDESEAGAAVQPSESEAGAAVQTDEPKKAPRPRFNKQVK